MKISIVAETSRCMDVLNEKAGSSENEPALFIYCLKAALRPSATKSLTPSGSTAPSHSKVTREVPNDRRGNEYR